MVGLTQKTIDLYDEIMSRHHFITFRDIEEVLHFDGTKYNLGGEDIIRNEIERLAGRCTRYTYAEILAKVKANTYFDRDSFDANPMLLNTVDGVLGMTTRRMFPHDPKMLFRYKLNTRYDPKAVPTKFIRFLAEVIEDPQDRQIILEMFAAALLRNAFNPEKAVILVGDGANGKSTLLRAMAEVFGQNNVAAMSIRALMSDRFAKADLDAKMLNMCGDITPYDFDHFGVVKRIVVGAEIDAERKHKNSFMMRPYAKLFFETNHLDAVNDTSPVYWRFIIIRFRKQFKGSDCNLNLLEELTTEEEKSGILNLLVDNAVNLMKQGCLTRDIQRMRAWQAKRRPVP